MLVGETVSEAESNARVVFRKLRLVRWVTKVQLHMYALSLFPDLLGKPVRSGNKDGSKSLMWYCMLTLVPSHPS